MSGIEFVDFVPPVPGEYHDLMMLQAMTYKATLHLPSTITPSCLIVQAWTSQCDRKHPDGAWHAINLIHIGTENGCHKFGQSEVVTSDKKFEFTFRVKLEGSDAWQWSHGFGENGYAYVEGPREDKWTQGPDYTHILGSIHLGNFIAATLAKECGFTHVLNVAENLDMVYPEGGVVYHKLHMKDGAHHPIESSKLKEAVDWLVHYNIPENKVLVNCRAGIGRAGSTAVAFLFAQDRTMTYEQAYEFAFAKRYVYPHVGLREQLYELYPRNNTC